MERVAAVNRFGWLSGWRLGFLPGSPSGLAVGSLLKSLGFASWVMEEHLALTGFADVFFGFVSGIFLFFFFTVMQPNLKQCMFL